MTKGNNMLVILLISLPFILLLSIQTANASIVYHDVERGQIIFDTETGSITGYTGEPSDVEIPSKINGVSVTRIGVDAFKRCASLANIYIPDSITSIGFSAFEGCESLTSINIPENIKNIDKRTFKDCHSIISITIPEGITHIDNYAFSGCSSLTSVRIPNSIKFIGMSAFKDCNNLETVYFYGNAPTMEEGVFYYVVDQYDVEQGNLITHWDDSITFYYDPEYGSANTDLLANDLGWFLISDKFKNVLENISLYGVQYLDVKVFNSKDNTLLGKYYVANIYNLIDALDLKNSKYTKWDVGEVEKIISVQIFALKKEKILGAHIFRLKDHPESIFISEMVKKEIEKNGITGCDFFKVRVTD